MSRLAIPDLHRQPAEPAADSEPVIELSRTELDEKLLAAEQQGFSRGVAETEARVRGMERRELEGREEALAAREKDHADAMSRVTSLLQSLDDETSRYNSRLEEYLEAASAAMAAHLLLAVNQSSDVMRDVLDAVKKRYQVTSIDVHVPPSMGSVAELASGEFDDVTLLAAADGEPLSMRLRTDSGELVYGLEATAEKLHATLLAMSSKNEPV